MLTTLMPLPKQQFLSALGAPLVGGKVYTYAAGTNNPKATYTDAAGTTPQENPIPLNVRGEPNSPIYWSGAYKVELRDELGNVIYTVDNYNTDPAGLWGLITTLLTAAGARMVGFIQAGVGAVLRTIEAKLFERASVLDYYNPATDNGDYTAAIQRAHDALPARGGTIRFTDGPGSPEYMLAVDGTYVNITKPNITLQGDAGAWVVSPNSTDPEVKTGNRYLNGFRVSADNCVVSVNMRGPTVTWFPGAVTDCLSMRNMKFLNMYNSGVSISGTAGFDVLDVDGVTFDTSRDLTSDGGNYEALSRGSNSTSPAGRLVRVNRCLFRGVSGAIDVHNVAETVVGGGTRFEGCDIMCIKMSTLDTLPINQNLTVDETVSFDGTAINPASANRHLACSGTGRAAGQNGYSLYCGFIQVFENVQWHGKARNFPIVGVAFLDGSYINSVINCDRSRFENVATAILDPQGTFSLCDAELINSNVLATNVSILRTANVKNNRMRNSYIALTKRCVQLQTQYEITGNQVDYSVDNNAPLRLTDYGTDLGPTAWFDKNTITITGAGNTKAIADGGGTTFSGGTGGTRAWIGPNNVLSAGATAQGLNLTAYEQTKSANYTGSLYLPFKNGEMTVVNTNAAAGQIIYDIKDSVSTYLPVGTIFHACRTSAVSDLYFACTGGINGFNSARATTQYAAATFKKIGANQWIMVNQSGTWAMA